MALVETGFQSDEVVTVPEAARQLAKNKVTLYRWIDANRIAYTKFGGILFIPKKEIERLKKAETGAAETPVSHGGIREQAG